MACLSFEQWTRIAALLLAASPVSPALATPLKVVVFDVEPVGVAVAADLQHHLAVGGALVRKLMSERGLTVVDTAPQAAKIKASLPLSECNGCDQDIAKALGADLEVTVAVQSATSVTFNVNGSVKDVRTNRIVRKGGVDVNGKTDDEWVHGFKFLAKERLLDPPLPADAAALRTIVDAMPRPQD